MRDYLNEVNDAFPKRRTALEKNGLFEYVKNEAEKVGLNARVEVLDGKHNNIIIGDEINSEIIYTAHYDTPARSLVPNLMMPRSPVLTYAYAMGIPLIIALISLGIAGVLSSALGLEYGFYMLMYVVLYFALFFLVYRHGKNKTNKNDNTSGVATVLSIMSQAPKNTAYILFDNEEKGLCGSKAYNKLHKETLKNKLIVNFDCVGYGNNIIIVAKENAEKSPYYSLIKNTVKSNDGFEAFFFPKKGSMTNTDSKSFDNGISVMACKKSKKGIFYTPNIHTSRDTVAYTENIEFLSHAFGEFSNKTAENTL